MADPPYHQPAPCPELGKMYILDTLFSGSCVLVLSQMSRAQVILEE